MVFRREAHTVQMLGAVHAQQTTHELTAESLLLELDASFHAQHLVASGHPRFRDADAQGPIALDADEISAALAPEGSVESIVATGNVHGSRNTPAGEDGIEAGRVQLDLATRQNVPRLLTAGGGVILTSRSATAAGGTRRVESEALEMHFSNGSRPGETLLESVNTLAPARIEWQNIAMTNGKPDQTNDADARPPDQTSIWRTESATATRELRRRRSHAPTRRRAGADDDIARTHGEVYRRGRVVHDRSNWRCALPRGTPHGAG